MKVKNLFLSMLAIACMLIANSCSQDEFLEETLEGDFVEATFTIATSDGIGTRADNDIIGKGLMADIVECAVFDADGKEMTELRKTVSIDLSSTPRTATYSVRLAKGQNYRIAFFAYNSVTNAYDVANMKYIIVKGDQESNVEGRDAFTGYYEVVTGKTMNAINETVILKRPFAQLNLGIDDEELRAAANAGIVVKESKIVVSNVYDRFSAYDNKVATNAVAGTMTFELNDIPAEKLNVKINDENKEFNYLALNYLLVGDLDSEKTLTDVEFIWKTEDGKTNYPTTTFLNIPVQRNYRTNIIGKLLTSPANFNIQIDAAFTDEHNEENPDYVNKVCNAQDLQAALDAAPAGEKTVITLGADIVGNVTDVQKPGRKVVIDGSKYKYNGTIKVHSNSNYYADAELTIMNLNFETSTASINCIEALENGSKRYSSNIIIDNCTFTATGDAVNTSVAVQVKATRNVTVKKCTATDMHSLIQAQSCDTGDIIVQDCTVNGKNGVAFKQVKSATVEGTTITAAAYGIRFDGNIDNYGIIVKDNNITASQPFIVRKMTGTNNTIALEGTNTLTVPTASVSTDDSAYQIIITNGSDDEAYVKPTGTYTLTGADDFYVYPRDYYFPVATWDEFTAALVAGEQKVMFTENITYEGTTSYNLKNNVEVNLNNKTFITGNASTTWLNIMGSKATFKNGIIEGKVYVQKNQSTYSDATFENVIFGGTITFSKVTQGSLSVQGGNSVYAKKCTFKGKGSTTPNVVSLEGTSSGTVIFEDCTFNSTMNRFYANPIGGTTVFKLINCSFNKAAVVETATTLDLNNLVIDGSKKQNVNLYIAKAKDSLTEEEKTILNYIKTKTSGTVYCAGVKY